MSKDTNTRSPLERHLQTILTGFVSLLCVWMASTIQGNSIKLAELNITVTSLNDRIEAREARALQREAELRELERRVSRLEN